MALFTIFILALFCPWAYALEAPGEVFFLFIDGGKNSAPRYYNAIAHGHATSQFVYPHQSPIILSGNGNHWRFHQDKFDEFDELQENVPILQYQINRGVLSKAPLYTSSASLLEDQKQGINHLIPIDSHSDLRTSLGQTIEGLNLKEGHRLVIYLTGHSDADSYHITDGQKGFKHKKLPWGQLGTLIADSLAEASKPSETYVKIFSTGCDSTAMHQWIAHPFFNICTASNTFSKSSTDATESQFSQGIWEELRENGPHTSFGSMFVQGLLHDTRNVAIGSLSSFFYATSAIDEFYFSNTPPKDLFAIPECLEKFQTSPHIPCPHLLREHVRRFSEGHSEHSIQRYHQRINSLPDIPQRLKDVFSSSLNFFHGHHNFNELSLKLEKIGLNIKKHGGHWFEGERILKEKIINSTTENAVYDPQLFIQYIRLVESKYSQNTVEVVLELFSNPSNIDRLSLLRRWPDTDPGVDHVGIFLSSLRTFIEEAVGPNVIEDILKKGPQEGTYKKMKVHALLLTYFHVMEHFYEIASGAQRAKLENLFRCEWDDL